MNTSRKPLRKFTSLLKLMLIKLTSPLSKLTKLKRLPKNQKEDHLNLKTQSLLPKLKKTMNMLKLRLLKPTMPKLKLRLPLTSPKRLMLMSIKPRPRPSLSPPKLTKLPTKMLNQLKKLRSLQRKPQ